MRLIADSGSTKTHWCIVRNDMTLTQIFTHGINPFFQDSDNICATIIENDELRTVAQHVHEVYFYGAGCANNEKISIVQTAIARVFHNAQINVQSDMLGAAIALLGKNSGIACILGTGANSCLFDGSNITYNVSAGGYILGDEGSGAVIGRHLMADYVKGVMPVRIKQILEAEYNVSVAQVIDRVYRQPFPNRYLANFTYFIGKNIEHKYLADLVYCCFVEFFERNIKQYNNWQEQEINFVGSVAYYFKELLQKAGSDRGCKVGKIQQTPIDGLIDYVLSIN